eukprot:TRINITY_DN5247_c0_g1_i1.p1 TRINITY_DN5247_c0_g1~~TRINITY_DN5247_c0_g1_i1.p1  ORF type:complete len:594 (-),score=95.78 TRINITY_DN5247_c0_g1_i1:73-1854(-)
MQTAELDKSVINLDALRLHSRRELIKILDSIGGTKALVIDPKLAGPLDLVAGIELLQEHGASKIYHLTDKLDTDCTSIIYLIRPKLPFMKMMAGHVKQHKANGMKKEYHVLFVPRKTIITEKHLEDEGVYNDIKIREYCLDIIPFDTDILSLELRNSFKECYLDGDRTSLFHIARALMKMQALFGIIPNIKVKGNCAKSVLDMMLRMRRETGGKEAAISPEIDTLILIDRDVDLITPMCTQLTYEGLIDELMGVENGMVELDVGLLPPKKDPQGNPIPQPRGKRAKIPLNSNDTLYAELRDLNITAVGPFLRRKVKELDEYYKKKDELKQGSVSMIRDFMRGLQRVQREHHSSILHTNVAKKILEVTEGVAFHKKLQTEQGMLLGENQGEDYIEEAINRRMTLTKVLRLLALHTLTFGGFPRKKLDFFKKEIIETYGFEHLFTLNNMEKLGLLKYQSKTNFQALKQALELIVDVDERNPNDIAYVYSGYAPISVRLIQRASEPGGWQSIREALQMLPGATTEVTQELPTGVIDTNNVTGSAKVTLVFFIGGVTYTELSALRYLSQQQEDREYIAATTKIVNGNFVLSSILKVV